MSTKKSTPALVLPTPVAAPAPVAAKPKATTKKSVAAAVIAPVAAPVVAAVSEPIKVVQKTPRVSKAKAKEEIVAVVAVAPVIAVAPVVEAEKEESEGEGEEKKTRKVITKQTVYEDFGTLISKINEEITKRTLPAEPVAEEANKKKRKLDAGVPIKFLRTVNKRLAVLQSNASKMMKLKNKSVRDNTKSGLMKPVGISEALHKFLEGANYEVNNNTKYARVDITRMIHSYVKDNNLRLETDKRVILPDAKLSTLLNFDAKTSKDPMTYFRLPQYLKSHFIKTEEPIAA